MGSIEIISFEGCSGARQLIGELEALQENEGFDLQVKMVPSNAQAAEMGLYGSPTIIINGTEYQQERRGGPGFY